MSKTLPLYLATAALVGSLFLVLPWWFIAACVVGSFVIVFGKRQVDVLPPPWCVPLEIGYRFAPELLFLFLVGFPIVVMLYVVVRGAK